MAAHSEGSDCLLGHVGWVKGWRGPGGSQALRPRTALSFWPRCAAAEDLF